METVAKVGNLTRDPELRTAEKSGKPFVTVGLAWTPYVPQGEPEPETEFYNVVAFGSLAENVAASLRKGQRVVVVGRGEVEEWTDREGNARTTKKILADGIGPDLRWGTARYTRNEDRGSGSWPARSDAQAANDEPSDGYGYAEEPF